MPTEVIELQAGTGGAPGDYQGRPDWSPTAQPPGKDGVMAHTPDPKAYHRSADGRTILPRATKHGASRAFDATRPGILNVDPSDPLTGRGGTLVDVEALRRDEDLLRAASDQAEGDPAIAWDLVTKGRAEREIAAPADAPPMAGYVVPSSRPGGQQVTGAGHTAAGILAPGTTAMGSAVQAVPAETLQNPAIHHKEARAVHAPQIVAVGPPVPAANQAPAPAQAPLQAPSPAQQAMLPPQADAGTQVDSSQLLILQTLQGLTEAVRGLHGGAPAPPQQVVQQPPQELPQPPLGKPDESPVDRALRTDLAIAETLSASQESWQENEQRVVDDHNDKGSPERQSDTHLFGLEWLQPNPQKPAHKVVFDLGPGGQHLKRFHHVVFTKSMIILIYDDRYEGDRFHPPATPAGERIQVTFPDHDDATYDVLSPASPRLSFNLGCLDILQLVLVKDESRQNVPVEEKTDEELAAWREEIPTRWDDGDADLEQAIRQGRFDGGGGGAM